MALVEILQRGYSQAEKLKNIHRPLFFRLSQHSDRNALADLAQTQPNLQLFDTIESQLIELIKILNPSRQFTASQLSAKAYEHIGGVSLEEYGVWVYYPWSDRLVHILDEKEFILLRTSRNQYKITRQEQEVLSQKRIGVIGLSVGQSVALTMAMERTFGEIKLADFDTLELTNLNRIRTGIHNLGTSKVVIAAREIAEIDPFLQVTCFPEGVTEENIDEFLLNGGKLDILVDECDSLDMKIICRQRARQFQIPVVMDTSDRGLIDIERFDLEPGRSILHGLIDHLDTANVKNLTDIEKIPYLKPMIGYQNISARLKMSEPEIGKTIRTWPQLASSVVLGGAVVTDVCRRIALQQFRDSGRYYMDMEEIISNRI